MTRLCQNQIENMWQAPVVVCHLLVWNFPSSSKLLGNCPARHSLSARSNWNINSGFFSLSRPHNVEGQVLHTPLVQPCPCCTALYETPLNIVIISHDSHACQFLFHLLPPTLKNQVTTYRDRTVQAWLNQAKNYQTLNSTPPSLGSCLIQQP